MFLALFFVLLVVSDGALIPWPKHPPLKTHPGKQPKSTQKPLEINLQWSDISNMLYWGRTINISIGTPEQSVKLVLGDFNFNYNLRVSTSAGGFKTDESSTFNRFNDRSSIMWENTLKKKPGPVGKDNMKIAGRSFKSKPFEILEMSPFPKLNYADFSFGRPTGKPDHHFIHSLLEEFNEKVIVLSYEKFDSKQSRPDYHPNLTLSIGARPENRCKNDWYYMPVAENLFGSQEAHWAFKADSVSAGKFIKRKPVVLFSLLSPTLTWPKKDNTALLNGLEASETLSTINIDCNTKKNVNFKMGKFEFNFTPKEYLNHYTANECTMMVGGAGHNNYYFLPAQFLYDKCLLLDYEKKVVGLASRILN